MAISKTEVMKAMENLFDENRVEVAEAFIDSRLKDVKVLRDVAERCHEQQKHFRITLLNTDLNHLEMTELINRYNKVGWSVTFIDWEDSVFGKKERIINLYE